MASRKEEKERLRQERMEREAAEQRTADRRKRLQLVGGAGLALAAVVAVAIGLFVVLGGDDDSPAGPQAAPSEPASAEARIPAPAEGDLKTAARAAGCELTNAKFEGANHQEKQFAASDYRTNPPTSGDHTPNWYEDGIYEPGTTPDLGQLVHTLEHGRINVQYKPGTDARTIAQLETFVGENDGYHMVMFENTTRMPYAVAATAWTQSLTCEEMNPKVFDALRTFRDEYLDKGPEKIP